LYLRFLCEFRDI